MEEEYLQRLEEELKKMEVFGRELPLSLHIISQAIDAYKAQLPWKKKFIEGYRADSVERPVLAEFLPLKPTEGKDQEEEEGNSSGDNSSEKKMDWLRCAQLGNIANNNHQYSNSHTNHHDMRGWNYGVAGGRRKTRRCWSSELHRRFIDALKQLGGAHVATPKHIREFMKVDGLTNDEVKSHLQKYRLHERRPSPSPTTTCSSPLDKTTTHAPPTVVLWMPQTGYATLTTTTASSIDLPIPMNQPKVQSNKVYTSITLGSQNSNLKKQNGSPKGPLWLGNYLTSYDSTSPSTSL